MKKILVLLLLSCGFFAQAQTSSVFHVESEYTVQYGYRYFFDKLNPQTGVSTQIAQLPIVGFFSGTGFFNCFGHYVFQGVDSVLQNGDNANALYEVDTLGNLIRSFPMDTAQGSWYLSTFPSAGTAFYYAIRLDVFTGNWIFEKINAVSGARTLQTLPIPTTYSFINSAQTITRNDVLWFSVYDQLATNTYLLSFDPANGQLTYADTLLGSSYDYEALNYDCANDTIYGFVAHGDTVLGAELIKIHGASGTVLHTGITAQGVLNDRFGGRAHTRLTDGRFYMRTFNATYLFPNFYVSGPTFVLPTAAAQQTLSVFCMAAPRETCSFYTACETNGIGILEETQISLFPNPVTNGLVYIHGEGEFTLTIFDLAGKIVFMASGNNSTVVSLASLAKGVYVAQLVNGRKSTIQKLIVEQ
ncbi:MAG: T9SS type A sorting domain-containing protein [Bacteroidia bacterium]